MQGTLRVSRDKEGPGAGRTAPGPKGTAHEPGRIPGGRARMSPSAGRSPSGQDQNSCTTSLMATAITGDQSTSACRTDRRSSHCSQRPAVDDSSAIGTPPLGPSRCPEWVSGLRLNEANIAGGACVKELDISISELRGLGDRGDHNFWAPAAIQPLDVGIGAYIEGDTRVTGSPQWWWPRTLRSSRPHSAHQQQ